MKIFIVQNVARQVEGDLIVVQVEKGYLTRLEAQDHLASAPRQRTEILTTDAGQIECFCVRGIYEVEVPDPMTGDLDNIDLKRHNRDKQPEIQAPKFTPEEIARLQALLRSQ